MRMSLANSMPTVSFPGIGAKRKRLLLRHFKDINIIAKASEDELNLEPGDSVYYLSTTPHIVAAKKGRAQIVAGLHE